jgi:hypothetical protein
MPWPSPHPLWNPTEPLLLEYLVYSKPNIAFPPPLPKLYDFSRLSRPIPAGPWPSLQPSHLWVRSLYPCQKASMDPIKRRPGVDWTSLVWFSLNSHCFLCCPVDTCIDIQVKQAQTWELRTSRNFSDLVQWEAKPRVSCLPSLHLGYLSYRAGSTNNEKIKLCPW